MSDSGRTIMSPSERRIEQLEDRCEQLERELAEYKQKFGAIEEAEPEHYVLADKYDAVVSSEFRLRRVAAEMADALTQVRHPGLSFVEVVQVIDAALKQYRALTGGTENGKQY